MADAPRTLSHRTLSRARALDAYYYVYVYVYIARALLDACGMRVCVLRACVGGWRTIHT